MIRFKSIKWKLQIYQLSFFMLVITALLVGLFIYEKNSQLTRTDCELSQLREPLFVRHIIIEDIRNRRRHRRGENAKVNVQRDQSRAENRAKKRGGADDLPNLEQDRVLITERKLYAKIWNDKHELVHTAGNPPEGTDFPTEFTDQTGRHFRWRNGNRELVYVANRKAVGLIGKPKSLIYADLESLATKLIVLWFIILIVSIAIGLVTSRIVIAPIKAISKIASDIEKGKLDERIPECMAGLELEELSSMLNRSFDKLTENSKKQAKFTTDASHELKTPLTIISNELHWLKSAELDAEETNTSVDLCMSTVSHMNEIVRHLLDLARLEAGSDLVSLQEIDLKSISGEVANMMEREFEAKQLTFTEEIESVVVLADPLRLAQVLINLVANAVDHTPPNGTIRFYSEVNDDSVSLHVVDSGEGIASADLENIFDRFYQGDESRNSAGLGLGLSISQALIKEHGSEIKVESELKKGSHFSFSLKRVS